MSKSIVLITGANQGIGFGAAIAFAKIGYLPLVGARDIQKGQKAVEDIKSKGYEAEFVHIDVSDDASVIAAAKEIESKFGHLDALINNAAIIDALKNPSDFTTNELKSYFETNVFGVDRTTRAMLPLLKKSKAPRIVNVSSRIGSFKFSTNSDLPYPKLYAYGTTKTALNALTVIWAHELKDDNFKVNCICPGMVKSRMNNFNEGALTPEDGAQIYVKYATLPADGPTGGFFSPEGVADW